MGELNPYVYDPEVARKQAILGAKIRAREREDREQKENGNCSCYIFPEF